MSDHERIGPMLASHERAFSLKAAEHEEAAEAAKGRKRQAMRQHTRIPDEARGRLEGVHDAEIRKHESQARINRRRAEHAAAGYCLHGPDESSDSDYMKGHHELIETARKTGRLRQVQDSVA